MSYDPLAGKAKKQTDVGPSLSQRWLKEFSQRKGDLLHVTFGDASADEKLVANTAFRIMHGFSYDPEANEALIEWAHDLSKNPDEADLQHLKAQGFLIPDGSRPSDRLGGRCSEDG